MITIFQTALESVNFNSDSDFTIRRHIKFTMISDKHQYQIPSTSVPITTYPLMTAIGLSRATILAIPAP